jgi:hypothetical protein
MRKVPHLFLAFVLFIPVLANAGRLKIYSYPKQIAAGQMGIILFESPDPESKLERSSCTAEKLISWVKQDVPLLRIEQKGKQVYMSLGSYKSMGDSAMASFMCPVTLEPGEATLYILNEHDASVPYKFTVAPAMEVALKRVEGAVKPLQKFRIVGDGFVSTVPLETANQEQELTLNIQYDKKSKAEQYTLLNKRMQTDWDRVANADFLYIEQGGKKWRIFVEGCGITNDGLALEFTAPPDLASGPATLTLDVRYNKAEAGKSAPLSVNVQ